MFYWERTILFFSLCAMVQAFEVGTELGTVIAYGSAMDPLRGIRFFMTGVDTKRTSGVSAISSTETHCYTAVGRNTGYDRKLFASPPMCLDVVMFGSAGSSANAHGIVTAMDGNEQPFLYQFNYVNYQVSLDEPFSLPHGYFPAVMVTGDETSDHDVYIALHPTNGVMNGGQDGGNNNVNLRTTRDYLRNFSHPRHTTLSEAGDDKYSPIIYKYNQETRQEEWRLKFVTTEGKTLITGMAIVTESNRLVVFGSTTGYGFTVGAGAMTDGSYWNGFMTWVNPNTGTVDLSDYVSSTHNKVGTAIRSQPDQDDFVLGMCMEGDKAYVVGCTTGKFEGTVDGGAFVLKLDTDRFDPTWTRQFVGTGMEFTHCVVHGNSVFVGGTISSDEQAAPRNGNDAYTGGNTVDIVVANLEKGSGATQWIRQIDSHRDDDLVNMVVRPGTTIGDVYLSANAWDLQALPEGRNEMYVLSIDQSGKHQWLNIDPNVDPITLLASSADSETPNNTLGSGGGNGGDSGGDTGGGIPTSPPDEDTGINSGSEDSGDAETRNVMIPTVVCAVALLVAIVVAMRCFLLKNTSSRAVAKQMAENEVKEEWQNKNGDGLIKQDADWKDDEIKSIASENKLH